MGLSDTLIKGTNKHRVVVISVCLLSAEIKKYRKIIQNIANKHLTSARKLVIMIL